ncbi:hypothetical protein KAH37_01445 [bacterium]|nr:hypothetical protein [bacterium]
MKVLCVLVLVFISFPLLSDVSGTLSLEQRIAPNDASYFGFSLAAEGDMLLVGALGNAHLFRKNSTSGRWEKKTTLPALDSFSEVSVAFEKNRALLGVAEERAVYIFERDNSTSDVWVKVKTISLPYSVGFGATVALFEDTVFVGAPGENDERGALYIFGKDFPGDGEWGEVKKIHSLSSKHLGISLALDAGRVVVGADRGVLLLEKDEEWEIVEKLQKPMLLSFGHSVAIEGNTIVVGAPQDKEGYGSLSIFEKFFSGAGEWKELQHFEGQGRFDNFASKIALKDGLLAVETNAHTLQEDSFFIFSKSGDSENPWQQISKIVSEDFNTVASSIMIDNGTVFVGSPQENDFNGTVSFFKQESLGGAISRQQNDLLLYEEFLPFFGLVTAISGDVIAISSPSSRSYSAGVVSVFQRNQGVIDSFHAVARLVRPEALPFPFGGDIALDGDILVVGAPNTAVQESTLGKVYIYEKDSGGINKWGLVAEFEGILGEKYFGVSVAINGTTVVVGSGSTRTDGAVAIFEKHDEKWGSSARITPPPLSYGGFGSSIDFDGTTIAVESVMAPMIELYTQDDAKSWVKIKSMSDISGGVSISGDTLAVNGKGVLLFNRDEGGLNNWGALPSVALPSPYTNTSSALVLDDAKMIVVTGPKAYLFTKESGWKITQTLSSIFSENFAVTAALDGDSVLLSSAVTYSKLMPEVNLYHYYAANREPVDISLSADSVAENSPLFTTIGTLSTSDDDEGDVYSYSVVLEPFGKNLFLVDGSTLKTAAIFNYEYSVTQTVKIQTEDDKGGLFEKEFLINITNIDEIPDYDTPGEEASLEDEDAEIRLHQRIYDKSLSTMLIGSTVVGGDETIFAQSRSRNEPKTDFFIYIFKKDEKTQQYEVLPTILTGENTATSNWGFGYALAYEKDTLIVTSHAENRVYIYGRDEGGKEAWGLVKIIENQGVEDSGFSATSLDNDTLIVGANDEKTVYIFNRNEGGINNWGVEHSISTPSNDGYARFGSAVAISGDTLIVGDDAENKSHGALYVFERNKGGSEEWNGVKKIVSPDIDAQNHFGFRVDLDKNEMIVGAYKGTAFVFERNNGGLDAWGESAALSCIPSPDFDFRSVYTNVAIESGIALVSVEPLLCIYAKDSDGNWNKIKQIRNNTPAGTSFADSIDIVNGVIIVGSPDEPALYLYQRNSLPNDIFLSNNTIPQESPPDTLIGLLSTEDADSDDTHFYTVVENDDSSFFTIDGDSLKLQKSFEKSRTHYLVKIQSDDKKGGRYSREFTIKAQAEVEDSDLSSDADSEYPDLPSRDSGCAVIVL